MKKKSSTTNPTQLLKKDHAKVQELFDTFEETGERASKQRMSLFEKIRDELTVHAMIEEEIFYPALDGLRSKEAKKMVAESYEEHTLLKQLLAELGELEPTEPKFGAKMKVLGDLVKHHAKEEEEKEIFPLFKEEFSEDEQEEIGARMLERKEALMAEIEAGTLDSKMSVMPAEQRPNGKLSHDRMAN